MVSKENEKMVEITTRGPEPEKDYSLKISDNGLKAWLELTLVPEMILAIPDQGPANYLKVEARVKEKKVPEITTQDIKMYLQEQGLCYGIKESALNDLAGAKESKRVLIAEGKAPVKGRDGRIEATENYRKYARENYLNIASFSAGDVVAEKVPARAGKDGIDIFGKKLPASPVIDIELAAGEGVELKEQGRKAVAVKNGRPEFKKSRDRVVVSVVEKYVVNGNIDKTTGNINYRGDLVVTGNISDYFDASVGNDISVQGNVANASINSGGNLLVGKSIISSTIRLGKFLAPELRDNLQEILRDCRRLKSAVKQITGEISGKDIELSGIRYGKILRLLIMNKFEDLPRKLVEFNRQLEEGVDDRLKEAVEEVLPLFRELGRLQKIENVKFLEDFIRELEDFVSGQTESGSCLQVVAGYIQNSKLSVPGNVIINKKGCINSNITATESIVVSSKEGFIRGGNYRAGEMIYTPELGTKLNTTFVFVEERLFVGKTRGPLEVKAPGDMHRYDPDSRVNLGVDENGRFQNVGQKPEIDKFVRNAVI